MPEWHRVIRLWCKGVWDITHGSDNKPMFNIIDDEFDGQTVMRSQEEASKKCSALSSTMWRVLMAAWEAYTMMDGVLTHCWTAWEA
jgi:hypothetical protein